jgi:hypothetical protein
VNARLVERPGARPSLHRLIGEAVLHAARLQEESRQSLEQARASAAELQRTVAAVRRSRERRAFGNGQSDAEESQTPG